MTDEARTTDGGGAGGARAPGPDSLPGRRPEGAPSLADLRAYRRGADWALVAAWGAELGAYRALADGPATAVEVAERLGASRRGTRILLEALVGLGAVRREDGAYRLTGAGRARFVDADTPDHQEGAVRLWLKNARTLARDLGEAVSRGEPLETDEEDTVADEEEGTARFMAAMAEKDPELVRAVVEGCLERAPDARRALDLGGGPGTFARAFVRRGLEVTLFDTPEVVEHVADAYDLRSVEGLTLEAGDFLESFPEGEWDVILLANITHIFSADTNADLLAEAGRHVAPGGAVGILDFVRGVSAFAPLFAITMLLNTEEGDTHARTDYERWLTDAGLTSVRCRSVDDDRQLVTAVRAGEG